MKPKISLITLGVRDLGRSIRFYHDGMGFPLHNYKEGEGIAMFRLEGSWLAVYPSDELAADATVPPEGSGFRGITLAHNVGSKKEVNAVVDLAVSKGAKRIKEPQEVFWGGYSGYFADPDGHLWEVAYNPFTDLT
jgi:catechol 2,3-dioxygenase-like lactoylglutathione lyase family enzyme